MMGRHSLFVVSKNFKVVSRLSNLQWHDNGRVHQATNGDASFKGE